MYVCLCSGITEKVIRQAVQRHHPHSMKQLRHLVPFGSQCGKCVKRTREIFVEEKAAIPKYNKVA